MEPRHTMGLTRQYGFYLACKFLFKANSVLTGCFATKQKRLPAEKPFLKQNLY